MNRNTENPRSFVLTTSQVYVPGSHSREEAVAKSESGGECCTPAPASQDASQACCASEPTPNTSSCCG